MKKQLVLILLSFFFLGKVGAQNISSVERDSLYSVVNNLSAKIDELEKELKYRSLYVDCMALSMEIEISNNSLQHTLSLITDSSEAGIVSRRYYDNYCKYYELETKLVEQDRDRVEDLHSLFILCSINYHFGEVEKKVIEHYLEKASRALDRKEMRLNEMKGILELYKDRL